MRACLSDLMGALSVSSCLVKELGRIAGMVVWLSIMCGLALRLSPIPRISGYVYLKTDTIIIFSITIFFIFTVLKYVT